MKPAIQMIGVGVVSAAFGVFFGSPSPEQETPKTRHAEQVAPDTSGSTAASTRSERPAEETAASRWDIESLAEVADPIERELATIEWASGLTADTFSDAFDAVLAGKVAPRILMQIALAQRWAAIDPDGARLWLDGLPATSAVHFAARALRALIEEPVDHQLTLMATAIRSPAEAVELLGTSVEQEDWSLVFGLAGNRIGELLPLMRSREDVILHWFFYHWARVDSHSAVAAIASFQQADSDQLYRTATSLWNAVLQGLGTVDPMDATKLLELPRQTANDWQIEFVLTQLADRYPSVAADWLRSNPRHRAAQTVMHRLAHTLDGKMALELRGELFGETHNSQSLVDDPFATYGSPAEIDYALTDPEGFAAWLGEHPEVVEFATGATDDPFATSTDFRLAESAMDSGGIAYAMEIYDLLPEAMRQQFAENALGLVTPDQFELAIGWANRLGDSVSKHDLLYALTQYDLERAIEYGAEHGLPLANFCDDYHRAGRAVRWCLDGGAPLEANLLGYWAEGAPREAMTVALEQLPEAVSPVMRTWASYEPHEASEFLRDQLSPGPVRDAAIVALITETYRPEPDAATAWVEQIGDPDTRAAAEAFLANPPHPFAP